MDSNIKTANELGVLGTILLYFTPNTYYPASVTELVRYREEVQFTQRTPPMKWLWNGLALVKLNNCFYTPQNDSIGVLSDSNSQLEVSITDFRGYLPKDKTHITDVLLELKEGRDLPRLCKSDSE